MNSKEYDELLTSLEKVRSAIVVIQFQFAGISDQANDEINFYALDLVSNEADRAKALLDTIYENNKPHKPTIPINPQTDRDE